MKIFFSSYKYDYGNKKWGLSFEYSNFYRTLKKMKNINKVFYYPTDFYNIYGKKKFNEKAYEIISKNKFDFSFFFLFKDEFSNDILENIKKDTSTTSIAWMSDDHWRFDNYSKFKANFFNWIVTTDHNSIKKYNDCGIKNIICSQWGFNQFDYKPKLNNDLNHNVSFIGQPHSNRKEYINKLNKENINVYCRGQGWNKGRVKFTEMIDIFFNSKINLNFTSSSNIKNFRNFVKIFLKKKGNKFILNSFNEMFLNMKVFFQKKTYQIKGRVFEITGSGGFLLTEKVDYLNKYFEIGKEIDVFEDYLDLKKKIQFYLENESIRKEIAKNGCSRVLSKHTYENRLNEIFNSIKKNN